MQRLRMREKAHGTKRSNQFCHGGGERTETRETGWGQSLSASHARLTGFPIPKWLCDVKATCVLLESEDSDRFPAHHLGWLRQNDSCE